MSPFTSSPSLMLAAVLASGIASVAKAADPPEVIHRTTGMNIPITADQFWNQAAASQPATQPRTRPAPGDELIYDFVDEVQPVVIPPPVRSTVFLSRAHELWLYKPDSLEYTPKLDWIHKPKTDWTYEPKRDWIYVPKRDWSYTPRTW
jgi:hypothetical protein